MARPFAHFDWNLRSCGWHGHLLYEPTDSELAQRLTVETPHGWAWRCLRCGDYSVGAPDARGPANQAPIVLRGRALRDAFILRFLAVERFLRGLLMLALAYGVYRFKDSKTALNQVFETYLPLLRPVADRMGIDLQALGPVKLIEKALHIHSQTLGWVALGVLAYGILQLVEGLGLWLMKRWGEYVAVVGTSAFVPFEVYEIVDKITWLRIGALLLNIFAVVYIVWTKRLFGVRGGHAAFAAERHSESVLEIETTALASIR